MRALTLRAFRPFTRTFVRRLTVIRRLLKRTPRGRRMRIWNRRRLAHRRADGILKTCSASAPPGPATPGGGGVTAGGGGAGGRVATGVRVGIGVGVGVGVAAAPCAVHV